MFENLIVLPIFNLLVFIYAILPGHNFGLALIIFTVVVRMLMWPLIRKQLHHAKAMRKLQPEIKKIKQATKGDRQKESMMLMQLYKEREVSPFSSLGVLAVQLVIFIGLYQGLIRVIEDPQALIVHSYSWIANLGWMQQLAADIGQFDATLFGLVDLSRSALGSGGLYIPALLLVIGSAATQYYQSKQLMPDDKNSRGLRQIMREASATGKQADQSEVQAATGRMMRYFIPVMIFVVTIGLASALALYWFTSGIVAYLQQSRILGQDKDELEELAHKDDKKNDKQNAKKQVIEGEVIQKPKTKNQKTKKTSKSKKRRKR
ncbi:MAG: YidC/Oxa1 family membrane protein insertase [Candidatus Saccharibacteria bacterium]|nr:YidC/Oxa1 family membrane protein insertase [Candidatus Saccharibacteria bacterium]